MSQNDFEHNKHRTLDQSDTYSSDWNGTEADLSDKYREGVDPVQDKAAQVGNELHSDFEDVQEGFHQEADSQGARMSSHGHSGERTVEVFDGKSFRDATDEAQERSIPEPLHKHNLAEEHHMPESLQRSDVEGTVEEEHLHESSHQDLGNKMEHLKEDVAHFFKGDKER